MKIVKENYYQHSHLLIIGNKCDEKRSVDNETIYEYLRGFEDFHLEYLQTSAKTGEKVKDIFCRALQLGYYTSKLRWDKLKMILFVYKYASYSEEAKFSWANLCEALPSLLKKKKKGAYALSLIPPEVVKRLISFI